MNRTIRIEDLSPCHCELVARWLSRRETNRWLAAEWRLSEVKPTLVAIALRRKSNRLFLVLADDRPCGLVGLADIDLTDHTAMVWYLLGSIEFGGRGYVTHAVKLLTRIAFDDLKLCSLYAWVIEGNAASIAVLRKVGFSMAGRIRAAACLDDHQLDRLYFDLINPQHVDLSRSAQGVR